MSIHSTRLSPGVILSSDDEHVSQAIQRAIRYADFFGQAISAPEIVRYLDVRATRQAVAQILARHCGTQWRERDGLYCLPGREALFARTRLKRVRAARHWRRARLWARVISHLPFVRMLAVTGSLAVDNVERDGDIDYFVVSARRRVWTTRLLIVCVVRLARLFGDELCPNYLVSTDALLIRDRNLFTARELTQMVPLFGAEVYVRMMALNAWALDYLPAADHSPSVRTAGLARAATAVKNVLEWLLRSPAGDWLEGWEMRHKIVRLRRAHGAKEPDVILNAEQCKGHFRSVRGSALRVLRS